VAAGTYPTAPQVSVRLMEFAAARVFVGGAVFEPGAYEIGGPTATRTEGERLAAIGAAGDDRRLSRALRAAGGIRPDADLSRVTVLRGTRRSTYDLRPAIAGRAYADVILLAGDQVDVPSRGCFQEAVMKPSPISPAGVKVFLSNLTVPATSNAQSLNGKDARELRWGTRFLQAAIGMNCVGGTALTNADRTVVLFTRNPITGSSIVVERRLEDLLRRADRDEYDPWIMPEDALACYDSRSTNLVDVARQLGVVASSVRTF
ncbi:MAG: polysaccharide biosynthesis protein, partial [Phyllobacteriaceae bacterium]|nr:polysaccharide biosynthesis protein [Phyllobacteriaceae bacterium]